MSAVLICLRWVLWLLAVVALVLARPTSAAEPQPQLWPEPEPNTARFQLTYNWQRHGSFASPYTAANSLSAARDKMYTATVTAFLGTRLWQNTELYFNPEVAQGVPFSGSLVGLGGFTNGEITRAAGTTPTLYRQRLFVRQTWHQGGGRQALEADDNQLAGWQDNNRVVLTVGNFSTLDVFDPNSYAKDPRTQFMNWGGWTYGAYDYAADSRGFGWGFALEWVRDIWALRLGRMTGPLEPNGLKIDSAIGRHYGDQLELERSHTLAGQPGKLRVLAWRTRARVASFQDATAWLQANPGSYTQPTALIQARNTDKIKYGIGINAEQALGSNSGVFLRAMRGDGRTETHAFTEVDGSLAAGWVVQGASWGRGNDSLGVVLMRNTISSERQRFLSAGGISFFIGDGKLNYRPEQIVEVYYSLGVGRRSWITADVQRLRNPAYNADRGPVNVYALRLHSEF